MIIRNSCLIIFALFGSLSLYAAETPSTTLTQEEMDNYLQQLRNEVQLQQQRVQAMVQGVANNKTTITPTPALRIAIEHAKAVLEVKSTLLHNFENTPSLQNQRVRDALLALMKQQDINMSDLIRFQQIVEEEKRKAATAISGP